MKFVVVHDPQASRGLNSQIFNIAIANEVCDGSPEAILRVKDSLELWFKNQFDKPKRTRPTHHKSPKGPWAIKIRHKTLDLIERHNDGVRPKVKVNYQDEPSYFVCLGPGVTGIVFESVFHQRYEIVGNENFFHANPIRVRLPEGPTVDQKLFKEIVEAQS